MALLTRHELLGESLDDPTRQARIVAASATLLKEAGITALVKKAVS